MTRPWDAERIAEARTRCTPTATPIRVELSDALDEIERLCAKVANLEIDLHAMRTSMLEAKRERNAALAEVERLARGDG